MNQDPGIGPERRKGAAVHLQALREALSGLGAEVFALDEPDSARARERIEQEHARAPLALLYERYALGARAATDFARRHGLPRVLEVNAPLLEEAVRHRGGPPKDFHAEDERESFASASLVLAVSRAVADSCVAKGAARDRVQVCPNAVDPERFHPRAEGDPLRAALVPAGRVALGFHGRLRPWHQFGTLARAIESLLERGHDVHLVAVGEGDFERELEGRVPPERRTLVGWLPHEEVARHVACFDLLPLTYAPDEPCYFSPLKLAEAMACAVVPVVPRLGDLAEAVEHARTGLVYEPASHEALVEALDRLVRSPALRAELGAGAREAVLGRTWSAIARQVLTHAKVEVA